MTPNGPAPRTREKDPMSDNTINGPRCVLSTALLAGALALPALGQTITVDTPSDVIDFSGAQTVADLPGPDGKVSLREAGLASDNTPDLTT